MPPAHDPIDILWVLACAVLVVLMQAGFTCVESGLVRAKNSINVAFKNLIDFCIASVLYGLLGFGLMFGASWHGLIGTDPGILFGHPGAWLSTVFFFQLAFCGTATTIVCIGAFTFGAAYAALWLINRVLPLRVSENAERIGLNIAEHGAGSAILDPIVQMDRQARKGDFSTRVDVEPETEAARIAVFYNAVLEQFAVETNRRQMAIHKLAQLANYDTLTGLGNRRLFNEALQRALRSVAAHGRQGALLYVDLDDFKLVNDRFGHDFGDELLRYAARRMAALVPLEHGVLGRLGGDEFAILLESIEVPAQAYELADALLAALGETFTLKDKPFRIHASIGITLFDAVDADAAAVLRRADEAMYVAKLAGKGNWRQYRRGSEEFAPSV